MPSMEPKSPPETGTPVKYHAHIPFDLIRRSAFIPDELLDQAEDKRVYVQTIIDKLVAVMLASDAVKYITIAEQTGRKVEKDGKTLHGRYIEVRLPVGQMPKVLDAEERPLGNVAGDLVIQVANN